MPHGPGGTALHSLGKSADWGGEGYTEFGSVLARSLSHRQAYPYHSALCIRIAA